jgi:hypothetical protein
VGTSFISCPPLYYLGKPKKCDRPSGQIREFHKKPVIASADNSTRHSEACLTRALRALPLTEFVHWRREKDSVWFVRASREAKVRRAATSLLLLDFL